MLTIVILHTNRNQLSASDLNAGCFSLLLDAPTVIS